jgi:hypothetical protein
MGGANAGARAVPDQLDDPAAQPHRLAQRCRITRRREPPLGVLRVLTRAPLGGDHLLVSGVAVGDAECPAQVQEPRVVI